MDEALAVGFEFSNLQVVAKHAELARMGLRAACATTHLHTQSRITAFQGEGFYTIGPCGEELTSVIGLTLRPTDPVALHYRHLGALVARQLQRGHSMSSVLLERARGYTTSQRDPVTGGVHCSLGAECSADFLVTSTLASQGPQAVGRAVALEHLGSKVWPEDAISFASCGDGSVNNSEWLSAINAAEYIAHRRRACPVLFCVSDNKLSISLRGHGWTDRWAEQRLGMRLFRANDGASLADLLRESTHASAYVRTTRQPALLLLSNVPRRFGHAATDRQSAYLSEVEIASSVANDPVARAAAAAVAAGVLSREEMLRVNDDASRKAQVAFEVARTEDRELTRSELVARVAASLPPAPLPRTSPHPPPVRVDMRRAMTRALTEALEAHAHLVYLGEDAEHGGYYRVTEGLVAQFGRRRVFDWPPDEASLVGCGIGLAQAGFTPLVEVPYAAYLSCGYNQFVEACFFHWLSNGRQPNGLILRMQGFDEGVFGGHFHTANAPPVFGIPGLSVLCYSNGRDWARGLRSCLEYAQTGGVSMLLDSTALLNRRHVAAHSKDNEWLFHAPRASDGALAYDDVVRYPPGVATADAITVRAVETAAPPPAPTAVAASPRLAVLTFGNGVPKALAARDANGLSYDVIDCPLLSRPPAALFSALRDGGYDALLLVDVCRAGAGPLAQFVPQLKQAGLLPPAWDLVTAAPTYNPLGRVITFVSEEDIRVSARAIIDGLASAERTLASERM